jgi:hypothetical protein
MYLVSSVGFGTRVLPGTDSGSDVGTGSVSEITVVCIGLSSACDEKISESSSSYDTVPSVISSDVSDGFDVTVTVVVVSVILGTGVTVTEGEAEVSATSVSNSVTVVAGSVGMSADSSVSHAVNVIAAMSVKHAIYLDLFINVFLSFMRFRASA